MPKPIFFRIFVLNWANPKSTMMQQKFYQDFAAWLDRWLQQNVGNEPAKLRSQLPADLMTGDLLFIAVARVFTFICRQCSYHAVTWGKIPPQQKTADLFHCSRWKIARAIKKGNKLM